MYASFTVPPAQEVRKEKRNLLRKHYSVKSRQNAQNGFLLLLHGEEGMFTNLSEVTTGENRKSQF